MPKVVSPRMSRPQGMRRHNPLSDDLVSSGLLRAKPAKRKSQRGEDDQEKFVDSKSSKRILKIGQELAEEDQAPAVQLANDAFAFESRLDHESRPEDIDVYDGNEKDWGDEEEEAAEELVSWMTTLDAPANQSRKWIPTMRICSVGSCPVKKRWEGGRTTWPSSSKAPTWRI